jgi:micrococcal nuclease
MGGEVRRSPSFRRIGLLLVAAVLAGCSPRSDAPSSAGQAGGSLVRVTRVVDGDTLHVSLRGRDVTIRLIGVDAPEVDWYGGEAECFGSRSGRFAVRLLEDERVRLEYDLERTDPYGRTLAYLHLGDGRMANVVLVRRGYATVAIYPPNDRHEDRLRAAESRAQAEKAGLWSACGEGR